MAMKISDYMMDFSTKLQEAREIADSTAFQYVQTLWVLNGRKSFSSLAFLKNKEAIQERINTYAPSTQTTLYATIVSALSLVKDKAAYKKTYEHWRDKMNEKRAEDDGQPPNVMSEKQEENYITWDDVMAKQEELRAAAKAITSKAITDAQYETLLRNVVLSLYTSLPPRRNLDYVNMFVVRKWTDKMPTDRNYYDVSEKKFIINTYKTARTHGQIQTPVPDVLVADIAMYLKQHPLYKEKKAGGEVRFLVQRDGSALNMTNGMTRILNAIFKPKKIASSMLRHIFITTKFGAGSEAERVANEKKEVASAMGHSVGQQADYVFKDAPQAAGGAGTASGPRTDE